MRTARQSIARPSRERVRWEGQQREVMRSENLFWASVLGISPGQRLAQNRAHNPKIAGSNPTPATNFEVGQRPFPRNRGGPSCCLNGPSSAGFSTGRCTRGALRELFRAGCATWPQPRDLRFCEIGFRLPPWSAWLVGPPTRGHFRFLCPDSRHLGALAP